MNNGKMKSAMRMVKPSLAQIAVVVLLVVVGVVAFSLGTKSGTHSGDAGGGKAQGANGAMSGAGHDHGAMGGGMAEEGSANVSMGAEETTKDAATIWTCSMHPQIQQDGPGKCPICGMDLVPMESDADGGEREFAMSESAKALAEIQTTRVMRRPAVRFIRLVGALQVDPTRRAFISADIGGRVDKLAVDYVGATVEKGQDLVELYSPELLTAQKNLLQAMRTRDRLPEGTLGSVREAAAADVKAARERLRLAGLTNAQIDVIAERGEANDRVTLKAPVTGTVTEKLVEEGGYVATGGKILAIADLGQLWAELQAYETDLAWLREGQTIYFSSRAYPGQSFEGDVDYIDPTLDGATRTVRVRVNVANPDGRLKPGMYLTGEVEAKVEGENGLDPLMIPETAPLLTGERAVVYVDLPGRDKPTYEGREVVLGPRTSTGYVVYEGLEDGEMVVTNGAFRIDSALQIVAKPSMMSSKAARETAKGGDGVDRDEMDHAAMGHGAPAGDLEASPNLVVTLAADLRPVLDAYYALHKALSDDELDAALKGYGALAETARGEGLATLARHAEAGAKTGSIKSARSIFEQVSNRLIELVRRAGAPEGQRVYLAFCPMAFNDRGGYWLQKNSDIANPYYGEEMYLCGTIDEEFGGDQ